MDIAAAPLLPRPPSEAAARIARGVRRMLADRGIRSLVELPLANARRADVFGIGDDGTIVIVEVKSGLPDFQADHKWQEYLEYCDRFYFAVEEGFPLHHIPETCGLILADAFGAEVLREATPAPLAAARRKALTLRALHAACSRLHRVEDPGLALRG